VGSASDPDYRLSLQSTKLGPIAMELKAGEENLVASQTTGSLATYKVNGVDTEAQADSRTVTIAPGLTLQLLEQSDVGVAANITVTRQSSALAGALASFAEAYNGALQELDQHRGDAGGVLSGKQIVYGLGAVLREMGRYSEGGGTIASLESLGLTFERTGELSFDRFALMAADFADSGRVSSFLTGPSGTGGFVKSAGDLLDNIERPVSGTLQTEIASVQREIGRTDDLIAVNEERVNDLRRTLQEQMAAADAAIARMEQQYSFLNSMFESMRTASESQL
jgi:flagellar hook-associated protein 2